MSAGPKLVREENAVERLAKEVAELNNILGAILIGLVMTDAFPQEAAIGAMKDLAENDKAIREIAG